MDRVSFSRFKEKLFTFSNRKLLLFLTTSFSGFLFSFIAVVAMIAAFAPQTLSDQVAKKIPFLTLINRDLGQVLQASTARSKKRGGGEISFNLPAVFNEKLLVDSDASVSGTFTAPNIIYGLIAGDNVTISEGQTPTISVALDAGTGLTVTDGTITNSDPGSAQNIFKNIKVGSSTISAGSNTDTLEFVAGSNITLSTDTGSKKITIEASTPDAGISGIEVDEGGTSVTDSADTLDFLGGDFDVTESPTGEANIQLAANLTSVTGVAGDFTVGSDLTVGSDTINDFTGSGLVTSGSTLAINLTTSGNTGLTVSNSGLEVGSGGLTLLKGCNDNEILKYTDAGGWACSTDAGGGGGGVTTIQNNEVNVGTSVDTLDFSTLFSLTASPANEVNITITADSIGDTQLAFDTGQALTTASSPTFTGLTVSSLTRGSDTITDFTGTGLQMNSGSLETTLGTSVDLASAEVTGILPLANGGTGLNINSATIADGQILIGNDGANGFSLANLTAGTGISISNGSGTITISQTGSGASKWTQSDSLGVLYPNNGTLDMLVGGTSSSSAKFAVLNVAGGTPTASVSAGTTGALFIAANGSVQTTAKQSLIFGGGNTGNLVLSGFGAGVVHTNASGVLSSSDVALGTETSGNYVATITGNSQVSVSGSGSETAGVSLSIIADSIGDSQLAFDTGQALTTASSPTFSGLTVASLTRGSDTITDFTGTGLQMNGNSLETTLGTSVDLASAEVTGILPLANGGTGLNITASSIADGQLLIGNDGANGFSVATLTAGSGISITNGSGAITISQIGSAGSKWTQSDSLGVLYPNISTLDMLVGGTTSSSAKFAVLNVAGGTPTASVSAGASGGLFVTANGRIETTTRQTLTLGGGGTGNIVIGNSGFTSCSALETVNGVLTCGTDDVGSAGTNYLQLVSGAISPFSETLDLLIGSTATSSAEFAITGVAQGTPTATLSATTNGNGLSLTASTGTLQSLNNNSLILGGSTTGNIVLSDAAIFSSTLSIGGDTINDFTGTGLAMSGNSLTTTLGTSVDLTSEVNGILPIASGGSPFEQTGTGAIIERITTQDLLLGSTSTGSARFAVLNIAGGTPTATLSAGAAGGAFLTADGNLQTTTRQSLILGGGGTGNIMIGNSGFTSCSALETVGGVLTCGTDDVGSAGTNYWQLINGAISPFSETLDVLIGSSATSSAEFAITGIAAGTPTATLSATTNGNGIYLNASTATLQSLQNNTLILGGSTTGNISLADLTFANAGLTLPSGQNLTLAGITGNNAILYGTSGTGVVTAATTNSQNQCLMSGASNPTWSACPGSGTGASKWTQSDPLGVLYPNNGTLDLLVGGAGTSSAKFAFTNVSGGTPTASFSAITTPNALSLDAGGNIFTTGKQSLTLGSSSTGNIMIGNTGFTSCSALETVNGVLTCGADDVGSAGTNYLQLVNGAISPFSETLDLLIGSTATSSAEFALTGIAVGTPTATLSATTNGNGISLTASSATLQSLNMNTLTVGGSTTGNILLDSGSGLITLADATTITQDLTVLGGDITGANGETIDIGEANNGSIIFTGTGQTNNNNFEIDLETNAYPTLTSAASIIGINAVLQFVGDQNLTSTGTLTIDATTGINFTDFNNCSALSTVGTTLTCGVGTNWNVVNGTIQPKLASTLDFLLGGTATNSAKFAVLNINSGTPTASLSAGIAGGALLTADGNLQTTTRQTLTVGGGNTGNIVIDAGSNLITLSDPTVFSSTLRLGSDTISDFTGTGLIMNGTSLETTLGLSVDLTSEVNGILPIASGGSPFEQSQGAIIERITTQDLLLGSTATASAKFAFTNVAGGTPTASFSAITTPNALSLSANGSIFTTGKQSLTLGSSSTGNIMIGNTGFTSCSALETVNGVLTCGADDVGSAGTNYLQLVNGAISPFSETLDLLVGSTATSSAEFAITGIAAGTPTATLSATTNGNGLSLIGSSATLQSLNMNTLTVGGATTGNIILQPLNGSGNVGIGTNAPARKLELASSTTDVFLKFNGTGIDDWSVGAEATGLGFFNDTDGQYRMIIDEIGNVGIGSAANDPYAGSFDRALEISGPNAGAALVLTDTDAKRFIIASAANPTGLYFRDETDGIYRMVIDTNGKIGINTGITSVLSTLDVRANTVHQPTASFSGSTSFAGLIVDNTLGDLFTASSSGLSRFTIKNNGTVQLSTVPYNNCTALETVNGLLTCGTDDVGSAGTNYLQLVSGAISPFSETLDLLVGATATSSAEFALTGIAAGTPTASLSATTTGNGLSLSASNATIQSLRNNTLTIGGNSTGDIILAANNGTSPKIYFQGYFCNGSNGGALTVDATGLVQCSADDSSAGAGTLDVQEEGVGKVSGATVMNYSGKDFNITTPGGTTARVELDFNSNQIIGGQYSFLNDILGGGTSTGSAKFAVLNLTGAGTPTATLSAGAAGGAYLTANGTLQTTTNQTLNFGGSTTGNLIFSPLNSTGFSSFNGRLGINTTNLLGTFDVRANSLNGGTIPVASLSGRTSFASLVVDNSDNGDIFAASSSGLNRFVIQNNGNVGIGDTLPQTALQLCASCVLQIGRNTDALYAQLGNNDFNFNRNGASYITNSNTGTGAYLRIGTGSVSGSSRGISIQEDKVVINNYNSFPIAKATLDIRGVTGHIPIASLSASTSVAGLVVDNSGTGDLFTASQGGITRFVISPTGNIQFTGNTNVLTTLTSAATAARTLTAPDASGTICISGQTCATAGIAGYWSRASGALSPAFITDDLLVGGTASSSALFHVYGGSKFAGTQTVASISANTIAAGLIVDNKGRGDIFTASSSGLNRFVINNNGNVGIGNALPTKLLVVGDGTDTYSGTTQGIAINNNGSGALIIRDSSLDTEASVELFGTDLRIGVGSGMITTLRAFGGTEIMGIDTNGNVGINNLFSGGGVARAAFDLRGNPWPTTGGTQPTASISAQSSFASLLVDNAGRGDLFTASQGGITRFVISPTGNIQFTGNSNVLSTLNSAATTAQTYTFPTTGGTICIQASASCGFTIGTNYWQSVNAGTITPYITNVDTLFGGVSSASATLRIAGGNKFAGTQTVASISANTSFASMVIDNKGSGDLFTASSAGLTRFVINNNGNVGIGTSLPAQSIHLLTNQNSASGLRLENSNTGSSAFAQLELKNSIKQFNFGIGGINSAPQNTFFIYDQTAGVSRLVIDDLGRIGIGPDHNNPKASLDLRATAATFSIASISGATNLGYASLVVDNSGTGNIFTASSSGLERFTIRQNGTIQFGTAANTPYLSCGMLTTSTGVLTCSSAPAAGTNYWQIVNAGTITPYITNVDTLFGGVSTASATLRITGSSPFAGTNSVASIAANTSFAGLVVDNKGRGDLFTASSSGLTRFTIANNGNITTNALSTTAFQVQSTGGSTVFDVDTANKRVGIGTSAPTAAFDVATNSAVFNSSQYGGLSAWNTSSPNNLPARTDIQPITANGYIYIIGGWISGSTQSTVYYAKVNADGTTGSWITTTALPTVLQDYSAAVWNGYVYVFGGSTDGNDNTAQTASYYAKINADGRLGSWTPTSNLATGVTGTRGVAVNGYLYTIGGRNTAGVRQGYAYAKINADATLGPWTSFAAMTGATQTLIADTDIAVANGYLYFVGGRNAGGAAVDVSAAKIMPNGSLDTFFNVNVLPDARDAEQVTVANGYLYVIGGRNGATALQSSVYYARLNADGTIGSWNLNPSGLPEQVAFTGALTINGNIYVIGGENASAAKNTVYYTPVARVQLAGTLDLIGLTSGSIASTSGASGGQIYAGNIFSNGDLSISGNTQLWNGLGVSGGTNIFGNLSLANGVGTLPAASISATSSFAGLVIDNSGRGDLFTASQGGITRFVISPTGNIQFTGNSNVLSTLNSAATTAQTYTFPTTGGTICIQASASCGFTIGTNYWQSVNAGTITPYITNVDTLFGGVSSASATLRIAGGNKFAGTQTVASISANTSFASMVIDNKGSGDLFTASSSGLSRFTIKQNGSVEIGSNQFIYFDGATNNQFIRYNSSQTTIGIQSTGTIQTTSPTFFVKDFGGTAYITGDGADNQVGINTGAAANILSSFDVRPSSIVGSTLAIASVSGRTSFAALAVDNSFGDLFTASSSGLNRFVIKQNGRVGVGTANPTAAFVVDGPENATNGIQVKNTVGGSNSISLYMNTVSQFPSIDSNGAGLLLNFATGQNVQLGGAGVFGGVDMNLIQYGTAEFRRNTESATALRVFDNAGNALFTVGTTGTAPTATLSANTSFAGLMVDNAGRGDLFTASQGGITRFVISPTGNIQFTGNSNVLSTLNSAATTAQTYTFPTTGGTLCIQSSASCGFTVGTNYWQSVNAGTITPYITNVDTLFGGVSTASATLRITGASPFAGTNSVASIAANTSFAGLVVDNKGRGDIFTASSSGLPRFVIKNNGNIGIGTTNPDHLLEITGSFADPTTTSTMVSIISNDTEAIDKGGTLAFGGQAPLRRFFAEVGGFKENGTGSDFSGYFAIYTRRSGSNLVERLRVTSGGSFGFNTTSPLATLDVRGNSINGGTIPIASLSARTSFAGLVVDNTGPGDLFTASSSGQNRFVITQNGNVGIGTTTPQRTLHVVDTSANIMRLERTGATSPNTWNFTITSNSLAGFDAGSLALDTIGATNADFGIRDISGTFTAIFDNNSRSLSLPNGIGTVATASVSGRTSFAGLLVDNSLGDVFAASASGVQRFAITQNGSIITNGNTGVTSTNMSCVNTTNGIITGTGACAASTNFFNQQSGLTYVGNTTTDFAVAGTSSTSALFSVTGVGGGAGALGPWTTNATAYNPSGTTTIYRNTAAFANGFIYNVGGATTFNATTATVAYAQVRADGSVGNWRTTTSLPINLSHAAVAIINNTIYAVGGTNVVTGDSPQDSQSVVYFARLNQDGTVGSWLKGPDIPAGMGSPRALAINGFLYIVGGDQSITDIYYTKPNADGSIRAWTTQSGILDVGIGSAGWVAANGFIYRMGGYNTTGVSSVSYAKINPDGSLSNFGPASSLPAGRWGLTAVAANGYVYVFGGDSSAGGGTANAQVYAAPILSTGVLGAWAQVSTLPAARELQGTVIANGYIYILGGSSGSAPQSTIYYASTARVSMQASLDLIGLTDGFLSSGSAELGGGSAGGSIFAGNIFSNANLEVVGATRLWGNLLVGNTLSGRDLFLSGNLGTTPTASLSATSSFAGLVVDNKGVGDIFTASSSGLTRVTIKQNGDLAITAGLSANGSIGNSSQCLLGGATAAWGSCAGGTNFWQSVNAGTITPYITNVDTLFGGVSTASATLRIAGGNKFAGTQTVASISANTSFGAFVIDNKGSGDLFTASSSGLPRFVIANNGNVGIGTAIPTASLHIVSPSLGSTDGLTVTAGSGKTGVGVTGGTGGNNTITAGTGGGSNTTGGIGGVTSVAGGTGGFSTNGNGGLGGNLTLAGGTGGGTTNGSTAGDGGDISLTAGAGGNNATVSSGNGGDINIAGGAGGTTGIAGSGGHVNINAGAGASGDGNINIGVTTATTLNLGGSSTSLHLGISSLQNCTVLNTSSGVVGCGAGGSSKWNLTAGALSPINGSTVDLLLGGISTASAKFSVTNMIGSGTPTASLSATAGGAYFKADGSFGTSNNQTLTIGGTSTGNILINPQSNDRVGIGTDKPLADLHVNGGPGTVAAASFSATTSFATLVVDNAGMGDIFTASSSGLTRFTIQQSGDIRARGNIVLDSQPNTSTAGQSNWNKISNATAGTIASGGTSLIASISASAVYNGSLYVGTYKDQAGSAEVYRYDGGTNWTKVSNTTAGTIASGGTTNIGSVSAMTVFDGRLYVGTSKVNSAEVYRYDGGQNWSRVNATAGTIAGGGTANIDGVASMAVFQGRLYIGTREAAAAQLYRYDGYGWSVINATAGTFITTNTATVNAIGSMAVLNGVLYFTTEKPGDADVVRYQGGGTGGTAATFLAMNAAGTTGSYNLDSGAADVTGFNRGILTVYNGSLIVGLDNGANGGEVLQMSGSMAGETPINVWTRLNSAAGTMGAGGTTNIAGVTAMTVYNGFLYVGTYEVNGAEIYRYTGGDQRFIRVSNAAGTIASGDTASIDQITTLNQVGEDLYAGTFELSKAEVYRLSDVNIDRSYALQFHVNPSIVGETSGFENTASIYYVASASANLGSAAGNTGAIVFSHGIQTRNGSYDVAEDYPTRDESLEPGDVVAVDENERGFVKKAETPYDAMMGVYSEKPGFRLTQEDSQLDGGKAVPVALVGRVPVKVTTEGGAIHNGDYLAMSQTKGAAMKANRAGQIIGRALEGFDPANGEYGSGLIGCPTTATEDPPPADKLCGKVMMYVSPTWYDPDVYITSTGNINIFENNSSGTPTFSVTDAQGQTVTRKGVFSEAIVGELKAGKLDVQNLSVGGVSINDRLLGIESAASGAASFANNITNLNNQIADLNNNFSNLNNKVASLEATFNMLSTLSGFTASSGAQLGLDKLDAREITVSDTLTVLGRTLLSDVGITGDITAGVLTIKGLDEDGQASINTIGDLKLQDQGAGGIDILNGKVTIDTLGNVTTVATLKAKTIETTKLNIVDDTTSTTSATLSSSAGSVTILAGETTIDIDTTALTNKSLIFVTPDQPVLVGAKKKDSNTFTIQLQEPQTTNLKVNWWIVN